ncbi:MAG: YfiR family protein [Candidatus Omnitrophota bacterium]
MKKTLVILFLVILSVARAEALVSENSLKAAFIFHFIGYIEWKDAETKYYVCIPDDDSLRASAAEAFKEKSVNNRPIVVTDKNDSCHILVSDNVPPPDGVLTIGPLNKGAMLEFRLINNKLKFAASLENIKKSSLKISSQLLKLAILEKGSS